jgi:hypothetical protein
MCPVMIATIAPMNGNRNHVRIPLTRLTIAKVLVGGSGVSRKFVDFIYGSFIMMLSLYWEPMSLV